MSRFTRGKRRTSVFLGAGLLALAFGVSVGVAKSGPSQVKVPFQLGDPTILGGVCGEPALTKKQLGKGTVSAEKGGPITIVAQFRGVETGKYEVFLADGDCTPRSTSAASQSVTTVPPGARRPFRASLPSRVVRGR